MTKEIILSDATKLAELIRTKEVSPVEVVGSHTRILISASVSVRDKSGRFRRAPSR